MQYLGISIPHSFSMYVAKKKAEDYGHQPKMVTSELT